MNRKYWIGSLIAGVCLVAFAQAATPSGGKQMPAQTMSDCSMMSADMQQFAGKLSDANRMMFCGKFSDAQRTQAMQMASQMDSSGNMMTPDQAVSKMGSSMGQTPAKSPSGCPVK